MVVSPGGQRDAYYGTPSDNRRRDPESRHQTDEYEKRRMQSRKNLRNSSDWEREYDKQYVRDAGGFYSKSERYPTSVSSRQPQESVGYSDDEYEGGLMIDRVPTAMDYRSEDSGDVFFEERSKASRYSVDMRDLDEDDDDDEGEEEEHQVRATISDDDDKYSHYRKPEVLSFVWSEDSDSCPAKWRSFSEDDFAQLPENYTENDEDGINETRTRLTQQKRQKSENSKFTKPPSFDSCSEAKSKSSASSAVIRQNLPTSDAPSDISSRIYHPPGMPAQDPPSRTSERKNYYPPGSVISSDSGGKRLSKEDHDRINSKLTLAKEHPTVVQPPSMSSSRSNRSSIKPASSRTSKDSGSRRSGKAKGRFPWSGKKKGQNDSMKGDEASSEKSLRTNAQPKPKTFGFTKARPTSDRESLMRQIKERNEKIRRGRTGSNASDAPGLSKRGKSKEPLPQDSLSRKSHSDASHSSKSKTKNPTLAKLNDKSGKTKPSENSVSSRSLQAKTTSSPSTKPASPPRRESTACEKDSSIVNGANAVKSVECIDTSPAPKSSLVKSSDSLIMRIREDPTWDVESKFLGTKQTTPEAEVQNKSESQPDPTQADQTFIDSLRKQHTEVVKACYAALDSFNLSFFNKPAVELQGKDSDEQIPPPLVAHSQDNISLGITAEHPETAMDSISHAPESGHHKSLSPTTRSTLDDTVTTTFTTDTGANSSAKPSQPSSSSGEQILDKRQPVSDPPDEDSRALVPNRKHERKKLKPNSIASSKSSRKSSSRQSRGESAYQNITSLEHVEQKIHQPKDPERKISKEAGYNSTSDGGGSGRQVKSLRLDSKNGSQCDDHVPPIREIFRKEVRDHVYHHSDTISITTIEVPVEVTPYSYHHEEDGSVSILGLQRPSKKVQEMAQPKPPTRNTQENQPAKQTVKEKSPPEFKGFSVQPQILPAASSTTETKKRSSFKIRLFSRKK